MSLALVLAMAAPVAAQNYLATGTYNGNDAGSRTISGIGFQPDLVIIKGEQGDHSVARTATMPAGYSVALGDNKPLEAGRILAMTVDGFTVDNAHEVNEAGQTYYWVAMRTGTGHLGLGIYTGDSTAFHEIAGLGFRPTAVIVISDESKPAILRTATMPNGSSVPLRGDGPLADGLLAFAADGFIVGANDAVNKAGVLHHYIAWPAAAGAVATGYFSGNGNDNRTITGAGLAPVYMLLRGNGNQEGTHRMASVDGDRTLYFSNHSAAANVIQALTADGMVVGSDADANSPGVDYAWIAFANPPPRTDLRLQMGADNGAPNVGRNVVLDLIVANDGPTDATAVTVAIPLPAGLDYQAAVPDRGSYNPGSGDWTVGILAAGSQAHLSLTATVEPGTGGSLLRVEGLAAAATPDEADPLDNSAAVDLFVPAADLALTALVNNASPDVGGTVVYTVVLTNAGPDAGTGLQVSAILPAGLAFQSASPSQGAYDNLNGTWSPGELAAANTAVLTLLARIEAGNGGRTLSVPFAVVAADQEDPATGNNSRNVAVTVTSSDLGLVKTVDLVSPDEGATVTFRIVASNAGPSPATGVRVNDVLPAGLGFASATPNVGTYDQATGIWTIGNLGSGASATLDLAAIVAPGTGGQVLTNTASIAGADQEDPIAGNGSASAAVTVSSTDLAVSKDVDYRSPNVGDPVTFTVTLTNNGTNPATGVAVTDSLPAGLTFGSVVADSGSYDQASGLWTVGTLAGGAVATLQVTATVDAGTAGSTIVNRARVSASDLADPNPGNNTATADLTVASTDLQLAKVVDNLSPNEGETVNYTITVTNAGPNNAGAVEITDVLPAGLSFVSASPSAGSYDDGTGLWNLGALADGATASLILIATVDGGTAGSVIANTAAVTGADLADPVPGNNTGQAILTVSSTDLQLSKQVDDATPSVGQTVVFTITLDNAGPNTATGVTARDQLPGGLTLVAANASQGTYDAGTGLWTVGELAVGGSAELTLTTTVDASAAGRSIVNTAAVAAVDQADLDTDNDSDDAVIDVPMQVVTPIVAAQPAAGNATAVRPGTAAHSVLTFTLVNRGVEADTLRSLAVSNLTAGAGAPDQATLDAEWTPLTAHGRLRTLTGSGPVQSLAAVPFVAGRAEFAAFAWPMAPGDTLEIRVEAGVSLSARDGAVLRAGVATAADIGVRQTVVPVGVLPLRSGQDLVVDGFVAAQAPVVALPSGTLAVNTAGNLVLAVDLPANGYLADSIYGLTLVNRGSAVAGTDIAAMKAWADDGNGVFDGGDTLLGTVVNSGELWQLTGLNAVVPPGGRRLYVTVDIAPGANPARDIRLELPTEHGAAVIMASGNDGPLDLGIADDSVHVITVSDRLVLTAEPVARGTALPGARDLPLLTLNLANTYTVPQRLQSLAVHNGSLTDPAATPAQRDQLLRQVVLRLDGDGDGELGSFLADPALGSGVFAGDEITFTGLDLDLAAGSLVRIFVTGDVDAARVADGDILAANVTAAGDIWAPGAALVAAWPLNSGAAWRVDGMIAAQVTSRPVPGRTLGPGDGPELALDLRIPANGYLPDRLVGLSLVNLGTAVPADLAQVRLWADDGDGVFAAGTDQPLGTMTWLNSSWLSPVLSHDIPLGGTRLFVSIDAAVVPTDAATIRFAVPLGGIVTASANSGPIDTAVPTGGILVLSTSALVSRLDFDSAATMTGRTGTLRLTVRNVGTEAVTGITPALALGEGRGLLTPGSPAPSSLDLVPGDSGEFAWTFTATDAGTIAMIGSATGHGVDSGLDHVSAPSTSADHRIHTAVPRLDTYPTANLPASASRGQEGLVPFTLTLVNPGDPDVAVARLDSLRVRLAETPAGPPLVPADLIARVELGEGGNVYVDQTALPIAGDEIVLRLVPPALITGSEPITLSLRIALRPDTTVPSFVMMVDGAGSFHAVDVIDGLPVPVGLGSGAFPIVTRQANLVSPAGALLVTCAADTGRAAEPGQTGVRVAALTVRNDAGDPTASAIRLQALGFTVRDTAGAALPDPAVLLDGLSLAGPSQVHFLGQPQLTESLVVLLLAPPLEIPVGANVSLELTGDLRPDAPLGPVVFDFGDQGQWLVEDTGNGDPVAVDVQPAAPVAGFTVVAPATALTAHGHGRLPSSVSRGTRDLPALSLSLVHPGAPGTADVAWDSLVLQIVGADRTPLDPAPLLDRVRLVVDGVTVAALVDPAAADGRLTLGLNPALLAPGDTLDLDVHVDVRPDAPLSAFELIVAAAGLATRDAVSGLQPALAALGVWPVWSGLGTVVVPAEELAVAGASLMPAFLDPRGDPQAVLNLVVTNTATTGSGPLAVASVTLRPAAADNDFPRPGSVIGIVTAWSGGAELGRDEGVAADAASVTVPLAVPLLVPAGQTRELEIRVGLRPGASGGRLRLAMDAADITAGPEGAAPGGIRIVPAGGQALPLVTSVGNVGAASLEDSYVNYPNPFAAGREQTTFAYYLRQPATVSLRLLTPHGEPVATLVAGEALDAGLHQDDVWTGLNGRGLVVRNGVYIAELVAEFTDGARERVLRKVAVLR